MSAEDLSNLNSSHTEKSGLGETINYSSSDSSSASGLTAFESALNVDLETKDDDHSSYFEVTNEARKCGYETEEISEGENLKLVSKFLSENKLSEENEILPSLMNQLEMKVLKSILKKESKFRESVSILNTLPLGITEETAKHFSLKRINTPIPTVKKAKFIESQKTIYQSDESFTVTFNQNYEENPEVLDDSAKKFFHKCFFAHLIFIVIAIVIVLYSFNFRF